MAAVEDARLGHVVAVRDREEPRPEVVVLALRERRVEAELVLVEHLAVDDDRRVEERRREQSRPPHGTGTRRHPVDATDAPVVAEVDRPGTDDRRGRARRHPRREPLEPFGTREIVGVEAREVPPGRRFETDVERTGEAERHVVPHDADTWVVDRGDDVAGAVDRAVVDDDELEIAERLPEHARHRIADRGAGVAGREDDGHGRRAHRHAEGSLPRCPEPSERASISWLRPSVERTSSPGSSARSQRRRSLPPAS